MKRFTLTITALFFTAGLFASGFNEPSFGGSGNNHSSTHHSSSTSSSACGDACSDVCTQACSEFIADMALVIWTAGNVGVTYSDYPYATSNPNYVHSQIAKALQEADTKELKKTGTGKSWKVTADASMFHLDEIGWGNDITAEALLFPIFGPYAGITNFTDDNANLTKATSTNLRIGGQFSLFQSDLLSLTAVLMWSRWFGDFKNLSQDDGLIAGLDFSSYPFKPVVLRWKAMWGSYNSNLNTFNSDFQVGIMQDRIEVFGGWKVMTIDSMKDEFPYTKWNGFSGGVRFYL